MAEIDRKEVLEEILEEYGEWTFKGVKVKELPFLMDIIDYVCLCCDEFHTEVYSEALVRDARL